MDEAGRPVPGSSVEIHALPRGTVHFLAPRFHARADCRPDGTFRVGPGPSPWWSQGILSAIAPGFHRASLVSRTLTVPGLPYAEEGEPARLVLRPGHEVQGQVRAKDGGPPDGPVTLWATAEGGFFDVVETDAAGAFRFSAPAGTIGLLALEGVHPEARATVVVAPGAANRAAVEVVRGRDIRGKVVDGATGLPVPGAVLRAYYGGTRLFRAGDDGTFVLPKHWFSGFQVRAPGYAARTHRLAADAGSPGVPPETVRLEPGFVVRGRVVDLDGAPLAGARLRMLTRDPAGDWASSAGPYTGKDGSFVFVGLPVPGPGREVPLFATAPECGWGVTPPLAGTAGAVLDGVEVRIPREVDLTGRVVDGDGFPVAVDLDIRWDIAKELAPYADVFPTGGHVNVLEDGAWRIRLPERTAYAITARGELISDARVEGRSPSASGPKGAEVVVKVDRGLSIRGTVVDAEGKPVRRGDVRVEPRPPTDPRPSRDARVREDGTFETGGLTAGAYDLSVLVHPEFLQEVVRDAKAGAPPLKVVLRRPGGLRFRVVVPGDVPEGTAPEVALRALEDTRPLAPDFNLKLDPYDPRAAIGPLAPAAYALSVTAGDYRADFERVVVGQASPTDLGDVVLKPAAVVAGRVTLSDVPLPGVMVEVIRSLPDGSSRSVRRGKTGTDGAFRLGGLLPGPCILAVRCPDRPFVDVPFEAATGTVTSLDVPLQRGGRLRVTVKDAAGGPVKGAHLVFLRDGAAVPFWREGMISPGPHRTAPDGTLRCTGLPAGTIVVKAEKPGEGSAEVSVTVEDGGERDVEVRIGK